MDNAICYNMTTGRIFGITYIKPGIDAMPNEIMIESPASDIGGTHYVSTEGIVESRPAMGITVTGHMITGIPMGSVVTVRDTPYSVNDGELDIEFTHKGIYEIRITNFPYLDYFCEIEA